MTQDKILTMTRPEQLFSGTSDEVKDQYLKLRSKWHPDHGGDGRVFDKVQKLYDEALVKFASGSFGVKENRAIFVTESKVRYAMDYQVKKNFELGEVYVGPDTVLYVVDKDARDLVLRAERTTTMLRYADAVMRAEYARYLPSVKTQTVLEDGRSMVAYRKTRDLILLRDVLDHLGGRIDAKHVAWMMSRLYNIVSYLKFTSVVHGDISPDTVYVSPEYHSVCLLGGWWYSSMDSDKLLALPKRTYDLVPSIHLADKQAKPLIDTYAIRATARELLGDVYGSKLLMDKTIPGPMKDWVRGLGTNDPVKEYMDWYNKCLIQSFGERKFVKFEVSMDDVYGAVK